MATIMLIFGRSVNTWLFFQAFMKVSEDLFLFSVPVQLLSSLLSLFLLLFKKMFLLVSCPESLGIRQHTSFINKYILFQNVLFGFIWPVNLFSISLLCFYFYLFFMVVL